MQLKRAVKTLYTTAPRDWIHAAIRRLRYLRATDSTNRSAAPLAAVLDDEYYARRNPLFQFRIEQVIAGKPPEQVLQDFPATSFDERIVEYITLANWLMQRPKNLDILDVGCVLNNKLVANLIRARCRNVWLNNPQLEPTWYLLNPTFYHRSPLEKAFPSGEQFPLITCLSTIEHIGYDNSQYGLTGSPKFTEPQLDTLAQSLSKLSSLLTCRGHLLVSVPYGLREAVIHPVTRRISSQVFDAECINYGLDILRENKVEANASIFFATPNAWVKIPGKTCQARYAEGCPAACAVAIISGQKKA